MAPRGEPTSILPVLTTMGAHVRGPEAGMQEETPVGGIRGLRHTAAEPEVPAVLSSTAARMHDAHIRLAEVGYDS